MSWLAQWGSLAWAVLVIGVLWAVLPPTLEEDE